MFDTAKGAAVSVAVLSGVTSAGGALAQPAPAPPGAGARHCATRALPVDDVRRGETSPLACADTAEEALALLGERPAPASSFAAAAAFVASDFLLAVAYDDPNGVGGDEMRVWGDCSLALNVPAGWDRRISSVELVGCSAMKLYTGRDFTGDSTAVTKQGAILGLWPPFNDNIHSMRFR